MKTYTIITNGEKLQIYNVEPADADREYAIQNGINQGHIDNKSEIKSFVDGNDLIEAYYTKQTAEEEFDSFLNLEHAKKINETTIEITNF